MDASSLYNEEIAARFDREQDDLDSLCADRELVTREIFAPNDWYGMASVLKAYAGRSQAQPLKVLLPHGVFFNDHHVAEFELNCGLPAAFVYERQRVDLYARHGLVSIPAAASFCYANRLVGPSAQQSGALYFPVHSTHWLTVSTDWETLADDALALQSDECPLSVVVYWRDLLLGHHQAFVDRGLPVVSAGHMYDRRFLLRLAHLLQSCERVYTNGLGSHVYYATHVGRPVRIIERSYEIHADEVSRKRDMQTLSDERAQAMQQTRAAFSVDTSVVTEQQRAIVDALLSPSELLESEDLSDVLRWAERVDRFGAAATVVMPAPDGVARHAGSPGIIPSAARRSIQGFMKGCERAVRHAIERGIHAARRVFPVLNRVRRPGRK